MAPMGLDSRIAGRVGEKHFSPESVLFYSVPPGPPRPRPGFCGDYPSLHLGSIGGYPPPHPGSIGGYPPPHPGVHFWTPKSEPKNRQNQWFWIPLSYLVFIGFETSPNRIRFLSSNPWLGYQRNSACRSVKGRHVSLGLSPGVRRTSVFAKGENLGARADEPRSRRQLCCLTDAAYPLRVLRPRK